MLGLTFYVTFIPVTVCECHIELKATWLDLTYTDTEKIDISKTHTETNTEKIFNTDTVYI